MDAKTGPISRPLTATHPKLGEALRRLDRADLSSPCQQPPPALLLHAVAQLNQREYFAQHETLERLWLETPGEVRHLYEGILLIGVAMHHLFERRNYHGAMVKLDHGCRLLAAFPDRCQGVDVARLRDDAERARLELTQLDAGRIAEFERDAVPRVHMLEGPDIGG